MDIKENNYMKKIETDIKKIKKANKPNMNINLGFITPTHHPP